MEPTLNQASIVLAASNHNPEIVSKEWLNQNDLLVEEPVNFSPGQNLLLVETANYSINVAQQRVTIATRNPNPDILDTLETIATRYIDALPNLSYSAVGLNSNWLIVPTHPNLLKETFLVNQGKIDKMFHPNTDYGIGGIVHYKYGSFQANLLIPPQENDQIIADFNYHSNITNLNQVRDRISCFSKATEHALDTVRKLLGD